jgi:hypothetical protein
MTRTQTKRPTWLLAPLSLVAAAFVDKAVTVEWSFPHCNRQDDWPTWAIYGVIPYERFSGVSSLLYDFQPMAFAANLALLWALCAAAALALRRFTPSIVRHFGARRVAVLGIAAAAFAGIYLVGMYSLHSWIPVASLVDGDRYTQLRPVGLSVGFRAYECTPSEFWFGPISPEARAQNQSGP